jgi:hypothetical protein
MDVIKKESYNLLHMRNKWNGAADVRGNEIVNTSVLILHTKV